VPATRPRPAAPAKLIKDLALGSNGTLSGAVVDRQGTPQVGATVVVQNGQTVAGQATTDAAGRFSVGSLRGGVYQVSAAGASGVVRAWSEGTAPPAAQQSTLLVTEHPAVRGQMPLRDVVTSDGFIIGTVAVAAIAIPLIVHSTRNNNRSGS
jgi:hypothetical protein